MKKLAFVCLVLAAVAGFANNSIAAPVPAHLTLTTDSGANLFVSILGGAVSAQVPFELSGRMDILADQLSSSATVNTTTGISLVDAEIHLSDQTVNIPAGFLGGVSAEITGAGINSFTSNGYIPISQTNASNPFTFTLDPGGGSPTQISIDEGLFTYLGTGAAGGLIGSGTVDFGTDPVTAEIPPLGQIGMVTHHAVVSDGLVYVTVSAPITFADTLITDPVAVDVDLSGAIVATGYYWIPEPSSVVLLGIAILGLIPMWRRIRK